MDPAARSSLHVADLCLMLLSALRRCTKWIRRSADSRSNDMKIQGGKGRGGQRVVKYLRKSVMVTLFLMLENTGGKGVVHRRKFVLGGHWDK